MECCPYEHNYAQGGNEWLEPTGSQPEIDPGPRWITARDASRPETDRSWTLIAASDALRPEMDPSQRWMTSDGPSHEMDHGRRWIAAVIDRDRIWMDDWRWMTGVGSQEMDDGRQMTIGLISNNSNFRQKHPGVPDGSDGFDATSYPLTENYTLPVAQATGRVAHVLHYFVVTFTHHQKDTCVTLFAGAAVMLKPLTQRLAMLNHSYYLSFNDFQNLCIQFVFSSMYLCIYIANMYSPSFSPPPLPLYLRTPAVAH